MSQLATLVAQFIKTVGSGDVHSYNEISLQLELGIFLREKNLRAEIAGNPLMTLDSGKKKEGKGSFWKAFCDLHARSGSVPDARLRDL